MTGQGGEYNDFVLSGMMTTLISMMLFDRGAHRRSNSTELAVTMVFDYINKNYAKKISIDDIATETNYHKSYLNRCIKQKTGVSLYRYLVNYRLERAMEFLTYSDVSVADVAEKVGFSGSKGFATAFKIITGFHPQGLRNTEHNFREECI